MIKVIPWKITFLYLNQKSKSFKTRSSRNWLFPRKTEIKSVSKRCLEKSKGSRRRSSPRNGSKPARIAVIPSGTRRRERAKSGRISPWRVGFAGRRRHRLHQWDDSTQGVERLWGFGGVGSTLRPMVPADRRRPAPFPAGSGWMRGKGSGRFAIHAGAAPFAGRATKSPVGSPAGQRTANPPQEERKLTLSQENNN